MSLLGGDPVPARPTEPPSRPFPIDSGGYAGPDWFQILRSLVFWVIALGIVFYVVRSYLRDHPELLVVDPLLREQRNRPEQ